MEETRSDKFVNKWNSLYYIVPLFEQPPAMPSLETFLKALSAEFGKVEPLAASSQMPLRPSELLTVVLWDHMAYYKKDDKWAPTELILYGADEFDRSLWNENIVAQFWDCGDDRRKFADRCRYSVMASNMLAAMLPVKERCGIMADYADILLKLFPDCIALYWPHSQRLVPREVFLTPGWSDPTLHFLDGGLHVRFFNIANSDEMLFDTLGLTTLGLPDLQCHCKGIEPNEVVTFLHNLAAYLYSEGDIIKDGNTVEGLHGEKWLCQHEDAMAGPMRVVLDICPGKYAGGGRC